LISQKTFQCALWKAGKFKPKTFTHDLKGYTALFDWLGQLKQLAWHAG
jgi:hypothetical protein